MTADPHETTISTCSRGHVFEDLAVAVEQTGGWCPTCDAPAVGSVYEPNTRTLDELDAERAELLSRAGVFTLPTSRIPRAAEPHPNDPGYLPDEIRQRRWSLLDYEIKHGFRALRRQVRDEFQRLYGEGIPRRIITGSWRSDPVPVNAGDDGRWGAAAPTSERSG